MRFAIGTVLVVVVEVLLVSCVASASTDQLLVKSQCELTREQQTLTVEQLLEQQHQLQLRQQKEMEQMTLMMQQIRNETRKQLAILNGHDCSDALRMKPDSASGVFTVGGNESTSLDVYCDMTTSGGGWTVFQRRQDGSENFYRPWNDYAAGFGQLTGEFWLGNNNLVALMSKKEYRLRVDLRDWRNNYRYAEYSLFKVRDASDNYELSSLGDYTGTAGDSLSLHLGKMFSTYDRDNDHKSTNCAETSRGAWWYNYYACHNANLNGDYNNTQYGQGVNWLNWTGYKYSLRSTEMKIRPVKL